MRLGFETNELPTPHCPEQYAIYNSRRKPLFVVLIGSIFVGAILLVSLKKTPPWHIWLCMSFFGLCLIVGLHSLLDHRPKLTLDERGMHDQRGRGMFIPWEAIREVSLANLASQHFLSLELDENHPDVLAPSATATKLNNFLGLRSCNINIGELRVNPDKLCTTALILSSIPPEERKTLLKMLVDTDVLLPGKRPDPYHG